MGDCGVQVNATTLAQRLGVSKARISQYVAQGTLAGCFTGEGRARRFDLDLVQKALHQRLDPGQMLGNGAGTRAALRDLDAPAPRTAPRTDSLLEPRDPDRYELARILNAEEDARRKRRDNERDEGRWVLADEVERISGQALAREIGLFEAVLKDAARAVADRLGVDYREVRQILMAEWRSYRTTRAGQIRGAADAVQMSDAEREANV